MEIAGRESEFSQLFSFCQDCLSNGKSGSAYLCGKPGILSYPFFSLIE